MSSCGGIRTVVVDDSPDALRAICSVVAKQPNLVFVGAGMDGCEALALTRTLQPDLLLLDLEMPIMNGLETALALARDCPATRIVFVTVHDTLELRRLCSRIGASGFIAKDVVDEELPIVVRELFGNGK